MHRPARVILPLLFLWDSISGACLYWQQHTAVGQRTPEQTVEKVLLRGEESRSEARSWSALALRRIENRWKGQPPPHRVAARSFQVVADCSYSMRIHSVARCRGLVPFAAESTAFFGQTA